MSLPILRSTSKNRQNPGTSFVITLPAGIQNGDLLIVSATMANVSSFPTDHLSKGWWYVGGGDVNSRQMFTIARIYNSSDLSSVYSVTLGASSTNVAWVARAYRNHSVNALSDLVLSTYWKRTLNGGSQATTTAPSITTPGADYLVEAVFQEGSNALGAWAQTTGSFTLVDEMTEYSVASDRIEYTTVLSKTFPTAGATGNVIVTYGGGTTTAANGGGMQIGIPGVVDAPISSGLVKRYEGRVSQTEIVIGAIKLGGGVVECVLKNNIGTVEIGRVTMTFDGTSAWGNARFTGLTADTPYLAEYFVDGVWQEDTDAYLKTLSAVGVPKSFSFVAGSCQFTGSNHMTFQKIKDRYVEFVDHGGDGHYADATTEAAWRAGFNSTFSATRFNDMLRTTPFFHSIDNHDRIMTNPAGAGTALNLGETDPLTASTLKHLYGSQGWATSDTLGQKWSVGRVDFIKADLWSVRDDGDGDPAPRTMMGSAQKAWFKASLEAFEGAVIVWFCQWTAKNHANGRWNSFTEETAELEAWLDARPDIKRRLIMIGGDSHSVQGDSGTRPGNAGGYRFPGIPSLNISGYNRSGDAGDGSSNWDIVNTPLRNPGDLESNYGGYSYCTVEDDGKYLRFRWEAMRVIADGTENRVAYFERTYGQPFDKMMVGSTVADEVRVGSDLVWKKEAKGTG